MFSLIFCLFWVLLSGFGSSFLAKEESVTTAPEVEVSEDYQASSQVSFHSFILVFLFFIFSLLSVSHSAVEVFYTTLVSALWCLWASVPPCLYYDPYNSLFMFHSEDAKYHESEYFQNGKKSDVLFLQIFHECFLNPCQNKGTCEEVGAGYVCTCMPGFTGKTPDILLL